MNSADSENTRLKAGAKSSIDMDIKVYEDYQNMQRLDAYEERKYRAKIGWHEPTEYVEKVDMRVFLPFSVMCAAVLVGLVVWMV